MADPKKSNGYWTKERCAEESIKYNLKSQFKKLSRSAFASAQRNGWLDELCSHMTQLKQPNGFWTKERCYEEALKYKSKVDFQKGSNSAYGRAHKQGWLEDICSHMMPHHLLNVFQTKERCAEVAANYESRSEFKKGASTAYKTARLNGWLDDICSHMASKKVWSKEKCREVALLYDSKKAFRAKNLTLYSYAYRKRWLDEICQHMADQEMPKGYWTKERCIEEALKYQTVKEFERAFPAAARVVRKNSWQPEVFGHFDYKSRPRGYWTKERCIEEALKYQSRKEFQVNCESAYSKARKNNWLDEICVHMEYVTKPKGYWNKAKCAEAALKYKTRLSFQKENEAAYTAARKYGWLDDVCSHMTELLKPRGYWTKERCLKKALAYETRTDFNIGCNGAYKTALRKGWLEEICSHMVPIRNEYLRCLYLIINRQLNKAYIGLTLNFERRKQEHLKGSRTNSTDIVMKEGTEFIQLTDYVSVEEAAELELIFVNKYENQGYILLNDRSRIGGLGGLGGSRLKWTEELCQAEALKYQTRFEFQKGSRNAHAAATRQGILDKICAHMTKPKRKLYWTKERLHEEALRYQNRSAFANGNEYAYRSALKNGWLDEICLHMSQSKQE